MPRERMELSFEPYQLELRHTFTVTSIQCFLKK